MYYTGYLTVPRMPMHIAVGLLIRVQVEWNLLSILTNLEYFFLLNLPVQSTDKQAENGSWRDQHSNPYNAVIIWKKPIATKGGFQFEMILHLENKYHDFEY